MASISNCTMTFMVDSIPYGKWIGDYGTAGGYPQMGGIVPTSYTISGCVAPKNNEEVSEMRGLWEVYVVDPEEGEVVYQSVVVARDAKNAEFKVLSRAMQINEGKYEVDDLDVISTRLGNVRDKREISEVRIVE